MIPNYKEALSFLRKWKSTTSYWVLTCICPENKKHIKTATFQTSEEKPMMAWLTKWAPSRNIYFSVNPVMKPVAKKASREDILSMAWLHVDIDPEDGKDIKEEQENILKILRKHPSNKLKVPTVIIYSGGGYQGFWKLKEPIPINGEKINYENAKLYSLKIENSYAGADDCHNVDRIMRLPGTLNLPNKLKRKKGRVKAIAKLIEFNDNIYPISDFSKASEKGSVTTQEGVNITGKVKRLNNPNDLPATVSDKCKIVIVNGNDPDDPQKWKSRSHALYWVCCELVRSDVSDEVIYSVITDPDFKISESVLDKGSASVIKKYAEKQITSAKEEAIDPNLKYMNEKYTVIGSINGKCRIISEEPNPLDPRKSTLVFQTFADFSNRYCNQKVVIPVAQDKTISIPLGKWWTTHPKRKYYDRLIFAPGHEKDEVNGQSFYNLWQGFAYSPKPTGSCQLFFDHMLDNICRGNKDNYDYLIGWMARGVQVLDKNGYTAIVLKGDKGTGKSFFAEVYGELFGRHYLSISNAKHLTGSFNAHLKSCLVLFADEAFYAGDKKHESVLKQLVTEKSMMVEPKGIDAELAGNLLHIIMASNDDWVVPAGEHERRFFVLDVGNDARQNNTYFNAIQKELTNGGYEYLLHYLMNYDISEFYVMNAPKTKALQKQQEQSFSADVDWWYEKLINGEIFEGQEWPGWVFKSNLRYDYISSIKSWNSYLSRGGSASGFGRFFNKIIPAEKVKSFSGQLRGSHKVIGMDGREHTVNRPTKYNVPTLKECRDHFCKIQGIEFEWEEIELDSDTPLEEPY